MENETDNIALPEALRRPARKVLFFGTGFSMALCSVVSAMAVYNFMRGDAVSGFKNSGAALTLVWSALVLSDAAKRTADLYDDLAPFRPTTLERSVKVLDSAIKRIAPGG